MADSDISEKYEFLNQEISDNIANNEKLYIDLLSDEFPINQNEMNTLQNYRLQLDTTDIDKYQQEVWKYFELKYQEQTKLKKFYFDMKNKLQNKIGIMNTELSDLQESYDKNMNMNQTHIQKIKEDKYIINWYQNYQYLLVIIGITLLLLMFLLIFRVLYLISNRTTIFFSVIIIVGLLSFCAYYIYIMVPNRSNQSWDLRNFETDLTAPEAKCNQNLVMVSKNIEEKKQKIDREIADKIKQLEV